MPATNARSDKKPRVAYLPLEAVPPHRAGATDAKAEEEEGCDSGSSGWSSRAESPLTGVARQVRLLNQCAEAIEAERADKGAETTTRMDDVPRGRVGSGCLATMSRNT